MSTKRWIESNSDATEVERELLASGLDPEPPAGAEGAVWQDLAATLGVPLSPLGAPAATTTTTSAKALTGLVTLGKGFVLGVVVSLGLVGVARLESTGPRATKAVEPARVPSRGAPHAPLAPRPEPMAAPDPETGHSLGTPAVAEVAPSATQPVTQPRTASAPLAAATPSESPSVDMPRAATAPSVAAFPMREESAASERAPSERRSQLADEAALLRRARAELRGNRLAEAFATLETAREKFSLPELAQEREALLIELLFQSGQRTSAIDKAQRFLVQYPHSPYSAQVTSIAKNRAR